MVAQWPSQPGHLHAFHVKNYERKMYLQVLVELHLHQIHLISCSILYHQQSSIDLIVDHYHFCTSLNMFLLLFASGVMK